MGNAAPLGASARRWTIAWAIAVATLVASPARADGWQLALAMGDEAWFSGGFGQHGFVLVDARLPDVARGRLHLLFNTDTLQAGLESIRLADGKLELSFVARGEALLAGLLFDYYRQGERDLGRTFFASYAQLLPSVKWHPADRHSLELVLGMRQWFFGRRDATDDDFTLPRDTFVFEPRLNYTYWRIRAPGTEWEGHRFHPRIEGVAFGLSLGLDRRTRRGPWGASIGGTTDPRNDPGEVIFTARQWLYAGKRLSPIVRLQFEEHASYGAGEDDLTRNRIGGMNPYVVPVAGLPWAAFLSEDVVSVRAALHLRPRADSSHEFGVGLDGAIVSDARRNGDRSHVSGAGGGYAFADLRFGRWAVHGRVAYAYPSPHLDTNPNFSMLVTAGVRLR